MIEQRGFLQLVVPGCLGPGLSGASGFGGSIVWEAQMLGGPGSGTCTLRYILRGIYLTIYWKVYHGTFPCKKWYASGTYLVRQNLYDNLSYNLSYMFEKNCLTFCLTDCITLIFIFLFQFPSWKACRS